MEIKVGDILELKAFDTDEILFEKVTSIKNTETQDKNFQIRTENLFYDFTNFYEILNVHKV